MLSNQYFYFQSFRKYVILFGSLFNNMIINRTDSNGNVLQIVNVPIQFATKEKMLSRDIQDPDIQKQAALILPRMSFELKSMSYDAARATQATNFSVYPSANTSVNTQFTARPWNLDFNLYVYGKNIEDLSKITEQILPFFAPDFTVMATMVTQQGPIAIPVVLHAFSPYMEDEGKFDQREILIWTLGFTLKGYFYMPIRQQPLINFVNTSIYIGDPAVAANTPNLQAFGVSANIYNTASNGDFGNAGYLTFRPGLDANGNPTTILANSIPLVDIAANTDWGLIEFNAEVK